MGSQCKYSVKEEEVQGGALRQVVYVLGKVNLEGIVWGVAEIKLVHG